MKKTSIKHIVLEVGGKELKLSPEEAKDLYTTLHEIYGAECNRLHWYYPAYQWHPYQWITSSSTGTINVPQNTTSAGVYSLNDSTTSTVTNVDWSKMSYTQ